MRHTTFLFLAVAGCLGCTAQPPATSAADGDGSPSPVAAAPGVDDPPGATAPEATPLPPWGWIETQGSPITPFCSAALVGPHTAVTATACIEDQGAWELLVGFGAAADGVGVVALEPLEHDARLTVLRLEREPVGATPADLAPPRPGASVRGVSQLHTTLGEPRQHWYWHGVVSRQNPDRVRVDSADHPAGETPNCHGDLGAPLFDEDGALIGVTVGSHIGSAVCATAFSMVAVSADDDAFDEALNREF